MRKDIEVLDRWAAYPNYYALILVFIFSLLMVNEILLMWIKDYPPFSHGILNVMYILRRGQNASNSCRYQRNAAHN